METQRHLTDAEVFNHAIREMANAVSERPGETAQQCLTRAQVATRLILGLAPGDMVEVMLAGHAVMFHTLLIDDVRHTGKVRIDPARRGAGSGIAAMNRAFQQNLAELRRCQIKRTAGAGQAASDGREMEARRAEVPECGAAAENVAAARSEPVMAAAVRAESSMPKIAPREIEITEELCPMTEQAIGGRAEADAEGFRGAGDTAGVLTPSEIDRPGEIGLDVTGGQSAPADGQSAAKRPVHLNRAQRRQLAHGRPGR